MGHASNMTKPPQTTGAEKMLNGGRVAFVVQEPGGHIAVSGKTNAENVSETAVMEGFESIQLDGSECPTLGTIEKRWEYG